MGGGEGGADMTDGPFGVVCFMQLHLQSCKCLMVLSVLAAGDHAIRRLHHQSGRGSREPIPDLHKQ